MDLKEIEKQLRAVATEVAEKAIADREATRKTTSATPAPVPATVTLSVSERVGRKLQAEFASVPGVEKRIGDAAKAMLVERGAGITAGSGLELNGQARSNEIIDALREKSFLIAAGAVVWTYDTELAIGKLGAGFTVSAVSATGSPSDSSPTTSDLVLKSYHAATKMSVSNQLLANPQAGQKLGNDALERLANYVDTRMVVGNNTTEPLEPNGIKVQTASASKFAGTANADANEVLADIGSALSKIRGALVPMDKVCIVMPSAVFYRLLAARDGAGRAFPELASAEPTFLGHKVFIHESVGEDVMCVAADHVAYGLALAPNVQVGLEGTNFSSNTSTIYGRAIFDVKLTHDKAAAFVTGAGNATTGWLVPA